MLNQRLKQEQQQALMQQAQQQSIYHPALLAAPQIPSGNLPPGFDPNTCRSVYIGNIHPQVSETLLQELFSCTGPIEGCKLVRKDKSSYGFVHYYDRRSAELAIVTQNGRHLFGASLLKLTGHMLVDRGYFKGFGFVSFRNQQDAQSAINDLTGKWLGSRQIRCNWATKGANANDEQGSDVKSVVELTNGSSEDGKDPANSDAPENNPQYTTVYVGNLAPEGAFALVLAQVLKSDRRSSWVQRDKGFGFVRFSTHDEAALAIQMGNAQSILKRETDYVTSFYLMQLF
ncbi:hypothetical protein HAX54_049056 [Datura stramonium]|uniref:RRM domain-containing protein n=1 Tax=Datura stramonium TaxID=4076 RepID=A0ABS8SUK0_DATST|nr:hypothetical protein [Datura stramonium]